MSKRPFDRRAPLQPGRVVRRCVAATALCITPVTSAGAQAAVDAVEASARARRFASEGIAAFRSGDTAAAHRKLVDATTAWPTQPAYLWTRAQLAAAARDTADAVTALRQFVALGSSRSLAADRLLAPLAAQPALRSVSRSLAENAEPDVHSSVRATLADSTLWPEGVTYDARARRFFVGSVRHRTVYESSGATLRALWPARSDIGAILGVACEPDGEYLWATTAGIPQMSGYLPADSGIAALLRVRIADGTIVSRFDLPPVAAGHTLGDVVVAANGDVFTSDSQDPVLYRLARGATALEAYRHPLFRSLQGVAPALDGQHVYLADYSHGLLRFDLVTGTVVRLADAKGTTSLGVDGLVLHDGALIGVQNGVSPSRIVRFRLDPSGMRITRVDVLDRNTEVADEPTIGVVVGRSYVYVANSQWEKHDETGRRVPGTMLTPAILLAVPLGR